MALPPRRFIGFAAFVLIMAAVGWKYYQSLVPAIHEGEDHALMNIAGGGFLRVERVQGGTRNLVGRPGRVLILHWFELGSTTIATEIPSLVDFSRQVGDDRDIEVVLIVMGRKRAEVLSWANTYGVPTANLYVDPDSKIATLIGVRQTVETLIYDPEGRFAERIPGPVDWTNPQFRAKIEGFKRGVGEDPR